ncbi:MAG: transposase, partial [Atopobiaceae bacterium]|nr:transposase [Atopobiaceae bacterium]
MAEKPDWVAGFDRPKGTEIKRIRGNWYLYERSWRYDPEIKRSRKVSGRCLGKITPEGLVPSVSREERAAKAAVVADVVEVGASSLAWSLTAEMRGRLERHFPARWREVYALAVVRAVREPALRRCAAHLEDSALFEALGRPSLTPAGTSSLLRGLGRARAEVCAYMREDLAADGRFLLFDGHRVLSASRGSDLAELGYDSKMRFRPQLNLIYAFSVGEGGAVPAYYKRYSGGTTDVTAFSDLLAESGVGASGCLAVADKGFASEDDFAMLADMGLSYVVPLKRGNRFAKGRIPSGPAGWDDAFTYNGRGISCMTVEEDGFNVHVYLD